MIDRPERKEPRFPPAMELVAAGAIDRRLAELGAGHTDRAISSAACGGDILFAEATLRRNLKLDVFLPFGEPDFLESSVAFAGDNWVRRYHQVTRHQNTTVHILQDAPDKSIDGDDPFVRNNICQLRAARAYGLERVRFICLWNGKSGDGPGGTKHMIDLVQAGAGEVYIINTNTLW